jgi:putative MATE family efflux protein
MLSPMSLLNADDRTIFRIAIPALGALAADPIVSIVDTAFVGRLGGGELASLGVAASVFAFAFFIFSALAYASTPLISRALGAGDRDKAGDYAVQALLLAVVLGVIALVALEVFSPAFVRVMGGASEIEADAVAYLRIRGIGMPAILAITVGHGVFRGVGDTKTPLYVSLGFNLINLILDPILIFGFDLGLRGAAIASLIATAIGGAAFVWLMLSGRAGITLPRRVESLRAMRSLLTAGSALTLRTLSLVMTFTVATSVAARLGVAEVAGHQVALQIWIFLALVVDAVAIAGQTLVASHLGDGDEAGARRLGNRMLMWGFVWGVALAILFWLVRNTLPTWFTSDPEVIVVAAGLMPFVALTQPLNGVVFVFDGVLIGAGVFRFLGLAMLGAAVVTISLLLVAGSITAVWWALTALMIVRIVPMAIRYASAVS